MEGDDREPAARLEDPLGGGRAPGKLSELVVHSDAQGLKSARGRMGQLSRSRRRDAGDHFRKFAGRFVRSTTCRAAIGDDRARDAA